MLRNTINVDTDSAKSTAVNFSAMSVEKSPQGISGSKKKKKEKIELTHSLMVDWKQTERSTSVTR